MENFVNILFGCPNGHELDTCPFKAIRDKSLKERAKWVESCNTEILQEYFLKHILCSHARTSNIDKNTKIVYRDDFRIS